jgi:hypothetical protein
MIFSHGQEREEKINRAKQRGHTAAADQLADPLAWRASADGEGGIHRRLQGEVENELTDWRASLAA